MTRFKVGDIVSNNRYQGQDYYLILREKKYHVPLYTIYTYKIYDFQRGIITEDSSWVIDDDFNTKTIEICELFEGW